MKKPKIEFRGNTMILKADSTTDIDAMNKVMNDWQDAMVEYTDRLWFYIEWRLAE